MGFYRGPNVVTNGLVLNLDAANIKSYPGSGTVWRDLSGNNNSGSLVNGPTFSSANGGSIVFDGSNDYVNLGNNTVAPTTDYSYSCWFKTSTVTGSILFGADNCGDSGGNYAFISAAGNVSFRVIGGISLIITSSLQSNDNVWHNLTCIKTSTTMYLYVDGNLANTGLTPSSGITNTTYVRYIGIRGGTLSNPSSCGGDYYSGSVASVVMYNRALSAAEVLQNYNALKPRFNLT
jgi:hypothetical protein